MSEASQGDRVSVHYRGTLDSGQQFDNSHERGQPIGFTVGQQEVIAGFDEAVQGMAVGDKKSFRIEPENAYGERREDMVFQVPREQLPEELAEVEVGARLQMQTPEGQAMVVTVANTGSEEITLDANHALAGEALNFEIEVVDLEKAA